MIFVIIGKSGSGKSTVAKELEFMYKYTQLKSYTTRKQRNENDTDHIYISLEDYNSLDNKIASVCYGGNYYCATKDQLMVNDIYIVEPSGLNALIDLNISLKTIYIHTPTRERFSRMIERGDGVSSALRRLDIDDSSFEHIAEIADLVVCNYDLNTTVKEIHKFIQHFK